MNKLYLSFILLLVACGEKKEFSGEKDSITRQSGESQDITAEKREALALCENQQGSLTHSRLLTAGLSRSQTQQIIRYEISALSCVDGQNLSLQNQAIAFDLDVIASSRPQPISYQIFAPYQAESIGGGILDRVDGSDLFGRQGEFHHWRTASLTYASEVHTVILEIRIEQMKLKPWKDSDKSADSFLQIGEARAIAQPLLWYE